MYSALGYAVPVYCSRGFIVCSYGYVRVHATRGVLQRQFKKATIPDISITCLIVGQRNIGFAGNIGPYLFYTLIKAGEV